MKKYWVKGLLYGIAADILIFVGYLFAVKVCPKQVVSKCFYIYEMGSSYILYELLNKAVLLVFIIVLGAAIGWYYERQSQN